MIRRRKIHKVFDGYISPEEIEKILREGRSGIRPLEMKHFQYIIIVLGDTNPEEVPATIAAATDTLIDNRATVMTTAPSLIIAVLGVPFPEGDSRQSRHKVVDALAHGLGDKIRIAHGECDGPVGNFGPPRRFAYGALIPGFSAILKTLLESTPGAAIEIPDQEAQ